MHTISASSVLLQRATSAHATTSPATGYFNSVKGGHVALLIKAWKHLAKCHQRIELDFDDDFVDTARTSTAVRDICQSYNRPEANHGVLAALYLQHRKRFMNVYQDLYRCQDGFCVSPLYGDDAIGNRISAYGYAGRSGPVGDIVRFQSIDPAKVGFDWYRPVPELWAQLELDNQLPLGIVNYDAVLGMINQAMRDALKAGVGHLTSEKGVENLGKWLLEIELAPEDPLPGIAIAAHAVLLQAM